MCIDQVFVKSWGGMKAGAGRAEARRETTVDRLCKRRGENGDVRGKGRGNSEHAMREE